MSVAIVTDSAASLPRAIVDDLGIGVVAMQVIVDDVARPDTEVDPRELLAHIAAGGVTTSAPNPAAWAAAIEEAARRADDVVVITVSDEMSSTHQAAVLAAEMIGEQVHVVDSRSAAGGQGLVVIAAARFLAAHPEADATAVVGEADRVRERVHLVATLDDLTPLVRSGRVPDLARAAAQWLHVNPMFEFRDGKPKILHPAMGHEAALHRMVHACLSSKPADARAPVLHLAGLDADATEQATALVAQVLAEVPDADTFIGSFGPVMLAHVGSGVVGLAWWWDS